MAHPQKLGRQEQTSFYSNVHSIRGLATAKNNCTKHRSHFEAFNDWEGGGCRKFVPVLGGDGTKIASPGNIFDQPPREMSCEFGASLLTM